MKVWNVFDKEKIILTGNPVRQGLLNSSIDREKAIQSFGLDPQKKTILIVGGSLGARTINNCVMQGLEKIKNSGVQFIWQTGKFYINEAKATVAKAGEIPMLHTTDFISDMAAAYTAADLVISRAGAGSISEFCLLQKPVILVPSPNVAEDHQTKNALALVNKGAALYVKDSEATQKLLDLAIATVSQPDTLKNLSMNIAELAFKDSANVIANEVYKLAVKYKKNMNVNTLKAVYFIGAGGIGMSALVRYFLSKGKKVGGYDRTPSELTETLIKEGAAIHYEENVSLIPDDFLNPETTLIVYTPAIPADHKELNYFREHGFEIQKRAQVLGMLTRTEKGLCVAGTHGKTTTSTMTAYLLDHSHVGCNAFLGGISKNYHTNLLLSDKSDFVVIEADEFDRSFHWLTPYATVITATDSDHLDIYGTHEAYVESFQNIPL